MRGLWQGHTEILHCFVCIPLNLYHYIAKPSPSGSFSDHPPAKDLWAGRSHWRRGAVSFFTNESKLSEMVGALHQL